MSERKAETWTHELMGSPEVVDRFRDLEETLIRCGAPDVVEAWEWISGAAREVLTIALRSRAIPYARYLETHHWQRMRELARDAAGERCQLCNSTDRLETHHKTYDRIGSELLSDLIVLCHDCHAKFHGKLP